MDPIFEDTEHVVASPTTVSEKSSTLNRSKSKTLETYNNLAGDLQKVRQSLQRLRSKTLPSSDPAPCLEDDDESTSDNSSTSKLLASIEEYQREKLVSELAAYKERASVFRQLAEERQAEIECLQVKVSEVEDERNDLRMRVHIDLVKGEQLRSAAVDRARLAEESSTLWQKKCETLEMELSSIRSLLDASEKRNALLESERQLTAATAQRLEKQLQLQAEVLKPKPKQRSRLPLASLLSQIVLVAVVALVWLASLVQSGRESYVGM